MKIKFIIAAGLLCLSLDSIAGECLDRQNYSEVIERILPDSDSISGRGESEIEERIPPTDDLNYPGRPHPPKQERFTECN